MGRFLDYARPNGEQVPNATQTADGFMSAADKAKLDGIPSGGSPAGTLYFASRPGSNFPPISLILPGTLIGDQVVSVWSFDGNDYTANFESTITVNDHVRQNSGSLATGSNLMFQLKRPT